MIKLSETSKIYVHCPGNWVTGGAELLHQLVSILNDNGREAYIVYYGSDNTNVPNDYKKYNIKIASKVIDVNDNIEVIHEGIFNFIKNNNSTQKLLWWMSVDNFYRCSTVFLSPIDIFKYNKRMGINSLLHQIKRLLINRDKSILHPLSLKKIRSKKDIINCYQSEYAQNFLQNKGFAELIALKDFINDDYKYSDSNKKENIILYNPKKGLNFTKNIIKKSSQYKWIPLENMSRSELIDVMSKAKIYIDFGFHPGKDRLPRECAMSGCCIITGMRGSASFFEDIPIPNKYKFKDKNKSIPKIIEAIDYIFGNYEKVINDFEFYRHMISKEKEEFEKQVGNLFYF